MDICNTIFKTDEIDPVVLNDAPPRIVHHIFKTGKLLFMKDPFMVGIGYGGRVD